MACSVASQEMAETNKQVKMSHSGLAETFKYMRWLLLVSPNELLLLRAAASCRPFLLVVNIKGNARRMIECGQHMAADSLL